MALREVKSFCRICPAGCGTLLTIDEDDRIVSIKGDRDNRMSQGYVCFKGLQAEEAHHGPARLLHPVKRMPDGSFQRIGIEQALDEIAERLRSIIDRDGPAAVAGFIGGGTYGAATAIETFPAFLKAIETPSLFSDMTVDKPCKFVTPLRLGGWAAGKPDLEQSEVALIFGSNPVVAHCLTGFLAADPTKRLHKARERGLDLVIVDPRLTETARYAKVVLQPYPGEDPTIAAGFLHIILSNGWEDKAFCAQHLRPGDLERLRVAVAPFTPAYVAKRAGIAEDKLQEACALFAASPRRGSAWVGTGLGMSPRSELADHLVQCINVVCGRFRRAGERIPDVLPWRPAKTVRAEVIPPSRPWEKLPPSRIRGARSIFGEMLSCNLADEILTPGQGRIRAMVNASGNLAASLPDQPKVIKALKDLELLVTVDPYMTITAKLSHYVLPIKMQYERADLPMAPYNYSNYFGAYAGYTPEILKTPPGSEIVDDWYIYWSLARRLGAQIEFDGVPLDMNNAPTSDELIALLTRNGVVPFDEIKRAVGGSGGQLFDIDSVVEPGRPEADGKFDIIPDDVAAELAEVVRERPEHGRMDSNGGAYTHLLAVRRLRDVVNSVVHHSRAVSARQPYNPAALHPDDLAALKLSPGDRVEIVSDHGRIPAIVEADATLRRGVVTVSHGWGHLPDDAVDYTQGGANTNLLISSDRDMEPITAMARLSAIPVNIVRR